MPIRHCEKCGLKVLIDDSQTAVNPFYCQRCTSSMKAESRGDTARVAASAPTGGAKAASIKVNCPHCKASFNGRLPKKPAKGSCPVCQKELILLPTGDVRAAVGFDVHQWLREQEAAASPPAEEPARAAPIEAGAQMPDWLDEAPTPTPGSVGAVQPLAGGKGPQGETLRSPTRAARAEPPPIEDDPLRNVQEMPEPAPEEPMPPAAAEEPPAAAEEPPPPAAPEEPAAAAPARAGLAGRKGLAGGTARRDRAERSASAAIPTGGGRIFLGMILVALPIAAIVGGMPMREKLKGSLGSIGERIAKGFLAIYEENFAPPKVEEKKPEPPPKEEKKPEPPKEPEKPDKEALKDEINKLWAKYRLHERSVKSLEVGANPEQKELVEKEKAELVVELERINDLRKQYKTHFGEDYDPTK